MLPVYSDIYKEYCTCEKMQRNVEFAMPSFLGIVEGETQNFASLRHLKYCKSIVTVVKG